MRTNLCDNMQLSLACAQIYLTMCTVRACAQTYVTMCALPPSCGPLPSQTCTCTRAPQAHHTCITHASHVDANPSIDSSACTCIHANLSIDSSICTYTWKPLHWFQRLEDAAPLHGGARPAGTCRAQPAIPHGAELFLAGGWVPLLWIVHDPWCSLITVPN